MNVSIVLGAGGPLGWAFHLGVVEGVTEVLGTEVDDMDRVVGTSAGGAIAASLLAGATTADILDAIGQPLSAVEREQMQAARQQLRQQPLKALRPQAPAMVRLGGTVGLIGLLPPGIFPTSPLRRFPTDGLDSWPSALWMPSVRLGDGQLVVFGRDRTDITVGDALEATSAVPGMFRPKRIGRDRFVDGAVASATHADLLVGSGPDLVVVASPMTRPGRGLVQVRARRQLNRELANLESAGTATVTLHPNEAVMTAANGFPRTNPAAGPRTVAESRHQTINALKHLALQRRS